MLEMWTCLKLFPNACPTRFSKILHRGQIKYRMESVVLYFHKAEIIGCQTFKLLLLLAGAYCSDHCAAVSLLVYKIKNNITIMSKYWISNR